MTVKQKKIVSYDNLKYYEWNQTCYNVFGQTSVMVTGLAAGGTICRQTYLINSPQAHNRISIWIDREHFKIALQISS